MAAPLVKAIINILVTVASVAYQQAQQKKLQKELDARKGFEFTVSGQSAPLPVVYGKQILGGIATSRKVTADFEETSSDEDTLFASGLGTEAITGTKSEFLHVQYALCHGGISGVKGMLVNGLLYDDEDAGFQHRIRTYNDTLASAPATHTAMGFPSTNLFTAAANSTATYRLNRDDYNYNGEPSVQFILEGQLIREVELDTGVYTLSSERVYSNNPALVLIDYLTNQDYGRGLPESKLDLESFYNAAAVCDTVVSAGRSVGGIVNGGDGTRDIPLYECNVTLDTEVTIRANIERILETMGFAEMMWTPEGTYKLTLDYPTSEIETDALIPSTHIFTDDNVLRGEVSLSWLSASSRINQATVNFLNEHEDFKEDSVTWPTYGSTVYNTYLTEDNQQPLKKNFQVSGITDPYHALARAEQEVRKSRDLYMVEFTADKQALSVEVGDLVKLTLSTSGLTDEIFKVNAMQVRADMSVKISAYKFSHEMLAWNVNDDIAYATRPTYDFTVEPPTSVVYTAGSSALDSNSVGYLTWVNPLGGASSATVSYTTADTPTPVKLSEISSNVLPIYPRDDWADGEQVTFSVRLKSPLGRLSSAVSVSANVSYAPEPVTSMAASEELYRTNTAAGVKARALLTWSHPSSGVAPTKYKVEYYRDEDGSTYSQLDTVTDLSYTFNDVRAGNYHFRITAISGFNYGSTPAVFTKEILGLSAIPADPTGFTGKVTNTGILFTWDAPVDLDVLAGGYSQIRYIRNDVVTPAWEIGQVIADRISGDTNTATLPLVTGYYLIKHFDSSDNPSAGSSQFLNSFAGPDLNVVETLDEAPAFSGGKVGCVVVGSNLELDSGFSTMTYTFDNNIDLGSVESVRLIPTLTAVITEGSTLVSDYALVSGVSRFSGPIVEASISFEVRHTDDDPSGSPTWSDWETFTVGNYRHRAFEFRVTAYVADTSYTAIISELSLTADKEDVTKRGTSTSSTSADVDVTFATPFYGGVLGANVPYVGVNVLSGSTEDIVKITAVSATGFSYSVYEAGARVSSAVNWIAVGQ